MTILQAIAVKKSLGIPLTAGDYAALDPDEPTRGIRVNEMKTWARYKASREITVVT